MVKVKSSNIDCIHYDADSKTLEVTFHSGKTYSYLNVSAKDYDALEKAESCGSFFSKHIKSIYEGKLKEEKKDE